MTLRRKILLIIGATLVALILGCFGISSTILLRGFDGLEQQATREDVQRVVSAFTDELANLSAKAANWAAWDDSYAFVQNGNNKFIQSNCSGSTFADLRLNVMLFVDASGRVVFSAVTTYAVARKRRCTEGFLQYVLACDNGVLWHATVGSVKEGVVQLPAGPLLLVSRPIVTSERRGSMRGTLIFGRYLDDAEVQRIAQRMHLALTFYRLDGSLTLPEDVKAARLSLARAQGTEPICTQPLDEQWIAGYSLWRDFAGATSRAVSRSTGPQRPRAWTDLRDLCRIGVAGGRHRVRGCDDVVVGTSDIGASGPVGRGREAHQYPRGSGRARHAQGE